jgi:glycosyltransferase involved in cell wall biosynthesis
MSESDQQDHRGERPGISVVVPVYNAGTTITKQLDALVSQEVEVDFEVIVVDNRSSDDSAIVVASWLGRHPSASHVRVVEAFERAGASYARNTGVEASVGELVVYADADDEAAPGWLRAMWSGARPGVFLGGRQDVDSLNEPGHRPVSRAFAEPDPDCGAYGFMPWAFGGNLAVWREAHDRVGGWNEAYTHGGDDVDYCYRLQLAGESYAYVSEAVMRYRERGSLRALAAQQLDFGRTAVQLYEDFAASGHPRSSYREVVGAWWWTISRLPYLLLGSARRRRLWLTLSCQRFGRLQESMRRRVLFL